MKAIITFAFIFWGSFVFAQDLTLENAFKIDEAYVTLDYIFGNEAYGILYFDHVQQLNDPVSNHTPEGGQDGSFYEMDEGDFSFLFSLDSEDDEVDVLAIGSNDELSVDYIYVKSGQSLEAISEDGESLFDLQLKDSINFALIQMSDTTLVSYLNAPENNITKITATEASTLISGVFKDTMVYTDPSGVEHKYFTNEIYNGFLLSINELGEPEWLHTSRAVGFSIVRSVAAGDVIVYAHDVIFGTQLDILNLGGDTISTRYLNNVSIMHVEATEDNAFAICGNYYRTNNIPDMDLGPGELILPDPIVKDAFVIKYDEDFNVDWFDVIGGDAIDTATKFNFDEEGGLYLTGCIEADGIFNGGNEVYFAQGVEDVFLTYFDPSGTYQWTKVFGGDGTDIGLNIQVEDDVIYLSGVFNENMDVDLSEETEYFISDEVDSLAEAFFFTEYSIDGPSTIKSLDIDEVSLYPNPFVDKISLNGPLYNIEIYNMQGTLMHFINKAIEIHLPDLIDGIYILKGENEYGDIQTKKISKITN